MITASGWRRAGRTARLLLSAAARRRLCHCHAEAAPDKGRTDRRAAQKSCDMRSTSDHPSSPEHPVCRYIPEYARPLCNDEETRVGPGRCAVLIREFIVRGNNLGPILEDTG